MKSPMQLVRPLVAALVALGLAAQPLLVQAQSFSYKVPIKGLNVSDAPVTPPGGEPEEPGLPGDPDDNEAGEEPRLDGAHGRLVPMSPASNHLGYVKPGDSVARQFVFENIGTEPITVHFAGYSRYFGDSIEVSNQDCGTAEAPRVVEPGSSCPIEVTYAPAAANDMSYGMLSVSGSFSGAGFLTIIGYGTTQDSDVTSVWSKSADSTITPDAASRSMVVGGIGETDGDNKFYLRPSGTGGSLESGFKLIGPDAAHFQLDMVGTFDPVTGDESYNCGDATVQFSTGNRATTSSCRAAPLGEGRSGIWVSVIYSPTATGTHHAQLVAMSPDAESVPAAALQLTGQLLFDAAGAWSMTHSGVVTPTPEYLSTVPDAYDVANTVQLYLINTGTYGALGASFTLVGPDREHFEIVDLGLRMRSRGYGSACSNWTAEIAADGWSTTACGAEWGHVDAYSTIYLKVAYYPKSFGEHSVAVVANSANGSVIEEHTVHVTGSNPEPADGVGSSGEWTDWAGEPLSGPVAFERPSTEYAIGWVDVVSARVENTGARDALAATFWLTGPDAEHFQIVGVMNIDESGWEEDCGSSIATDGQAATLCSSTSVQPHLAVTLAYIPKGPGNHTATLMGMLQDGTPIEGGVTVVASN